MSFLRKNLFVCGIITVLLLAWLFPGLGAKDGILKTGLTTKLGVMVIFFLQGTTLRTRQLASSLGNLKLHSFVLGWIFIFSALIHLAMAWLLHSLSMDVLAQGFIYLALIPTTITSAIIFTSAANGNIPASIFNTTVSNVAGVFWVPFGFVLFFSSNGGVQLQLVGPLLFKVSQLILLPLIAGQILRPFIREKKWFQSISPKLKILNHGIILFIVFSSFSQSFLSNAWEGIQPQSLIVLILLTSLTVVIVHGGVWKSSGWIGLNREDRITALYCGSQKTLAAGAPMAVAILAGSQQFNQINQGLLLLPLLCYHPMQLLLAAIVLKRLEK
ncbi:MAG: bile acid:sodium symporter family protein [Puniceicoccaceae bacterium]